MILVVDKALSCTCAAWLTDNYCPGQKFCHRRHSIAAFARDCLAGDYRIRIERADVYLITGWEEGICERLFPHIGVGKSCIASHRPTYWWTIAPTTNVDGMPIIGSAISRTNVNSVCKKIVLSTRIFADPLDIQKSVRKWPRVQASSR